MHFYIEHNFGHHLNVGTPKDGATARFNQNLYSFWFTSVTRQYLSAWKIQIEILNRQGLSFFHKKRYAMVSSNSANIFNFNLCFLFI